MPNFSSDFWLGHSSFSVLNSVLRVNIFLMSTMSESSSGASHDVSGIAKLSFWALPSCSLDFSSHLLKSCRGFHAKECGL